jgi:hypothetical protein
MSSPHTETHVHSKRPAPRNLPRSREASPAGFTQEHLPYRCFPVLSHEPHPLVYRPRRLDVSTSRTQYAQIETHMDVVVATRARVAQANYAG